MKSLFTALLLLLCLATAQAQRPSARILLIPLDDRPPCLQFPTLMAQVGNAEIVSPPKELLGRFTVPGQPEKIAEWLKKQDLRRFDAAIISVDMLAYGGLVASRVNAVTLDTARQRLAVIDWLRRKNPRLPLYGSSVIMRLAPTADGKNEAYREKLARWAELSPYRAESVKVKAEVERLENEIPAVALADYRAARQRNLAINQAALTLVARGTLRYLLFSQDDAHPQGVHVADRERLIADIKQAGLTSQVAVQPGADEVSMLLLSRALTERFNYHPRIAALYSSETVRRKVFPFEDREINRTVSYHIAAAGGVETAKPEDADILFYVYGSRKEAGVAEKFAAEIAQAVNTRRRVIVTDVDPGGDVQGADSNFMNALRQLKVLPHLSGYGAWNTAGNAIGTALPHGIIFNIAVNRLPASAARRYGPAQVKFLVHRLADDYLFHSLVRPDARALAVKQNWKPNFLSGNELATIEDFCRIALRKEIAQLWGEMQTETVSIPNRRTGVALKLADYQITNFTFALPWGRLFEADLDFALLPLARLSR